MRPSLNQHRQALDRIDSTQEKRNSWSASSHSFSPGTYNPWSLLRQIDAVRNRRYGNSEVEMLQVQSFCLGRCNMATCLFQIATLIRKPSETLLEAFVVDRPRFKHPPR